MTITDREGMKIKPARSPPGGLVVQGVDSSYLAELILHGLAALSSFLKFRAQHSYGLHDLHTRVKASPVMKVTLGKTRETTQPRKRRASACRTKEAHWIALSEQEAKRAAKMLATPFVPNDAAREVAEKWADVPQLG